MARSFALFCNHSKGRQGLDNGCSFLHRLQSPRLPLREFNATFSPEEETLAGLYHLLNLPPGANVVIIFYERLSPIPPCRFA